MTHILANSAQELNLVHDLLAKKVPSYRQAYSDRTAWLMACVAELAYLRFNSLFSVAHQKDYFLNAIEKLLNESKKASLVKLLDIVGYDHEKEKITLEEELGVVQMTLVDTFDEDGTQAILVLFGDYLVLGFRGTEATSIKDIKADAKAKTTASETGGKIHSGFKEAYEKVSFDIQKALNKEEFRDKSLFITGHSLGGALATIAAKNLSHKAGLAGCYTFGSPRVGDADWIEDIKTPIYRVVNAADCVTMLPPGSDIINGVSWFTRFIPAFGDSISRFLLSNFGGYLHSGDMRYLTNCAAGQYEDVKLLYAVTIFHRVKGLMMHHLSWKHFLADHSMSNYREKLKIIARNRNDIA
ncbi:MAG: lipase family protein [Gammaproteobacteria bacterium]|nr:lipase family protein [Gammaproteobacteria bacterium]